MFANSRAVTTNQEGVHPALEATVRRHLAHPWRGPVADHDRDAFARAVDWVGTAGDRLILDSGCGTGRSSVALARAYPEALVLGLDQSQHRLQRAARRFAPLPDNLLLLQTDCTGFWRLAAQAGWRPWRHYILYPNPWPKSAHMKRRWHGHPVFPALLELGGTLEMRSNWPLYLQEARAALALAGSSSDIAPLSLDQGALTDFEEKYAASGQRLWRLTAKPGR